jgi:glycogen debranching enzyme
MKGRIPHEIVTNGNVFSWGHIMETTLFVRAVLDTYLWTGDEAFFDALYPICRAGILEYVLAQRRSDGMILLEYQDRPDSLREKLCPSFVVFGLEALAEMARRRKDEEACDVCTQQAALMRNQVEELFWDEAAGLYATALDAKNKPVVHFPGGFWPLQSGSLEAAFCSVAEKKRIERALSRIEGPEYMSEWGFFLTKDRNITMPITAGLAAIGEFNYGRIDHGMEFLRLIAKTKGHVMPGGFPEYVHPSGDPAKFPASSCFVQLWSAAMLIQGLAWGLLRPEPDIPRGKLTVKPRLPSGWASARFSRMRIGRSTYSFAIDEKEARFEHLDGPELKIISKGDRDIS